MAFKKVNEPYIYINAAADYNDIFSPVSMLAKISILTAVIALVIAAFIILFITGSISKPLNQVVKSLKDAAQGDGDLTTRIQVNSSDETGELAESFNIFIGKIQGIITDLAGNSKELTLSAENLADISTEMTDSSADTSRLTAEVADSSAKVKDSIASVAQILDATSENINTVAVAADQMSSTINEIASNTANANQISQAAVNRAIEVTDQMDELGNWASEITHVTGVIADISEQVNLLALNATIEAARAGEAGKGFAVVASEIKDLAMQTAAATDEIRSKIQGIQSATDTTIAGIKNITDTVNETNEIVTTIASAIEEQSSATQEIAGNISQVSDGVNEVNSAMSQAAGGTVHIAEQIEQVKSSTDQLSANSTRVNKKAEELSSLAGSLDSLVTQFKV
jgi:methyl-accepting chemotaxis protein